MSKLTLDDGMTIWKARDAYRVQVFLGGLFYLPQVALGLAALLSVTHGAWTVTAACLVAIAAMHGARWLLGTGLPRLARRAWRWAQTFLPVACLVLGLGGVVSGCAEYGYRLNELYGLNCRPAALQDGKCVASR